jgi:hypothetical protein
VDPARVPLTLKLLVDQRVLSEDLEDLCLTRQVVQWQKQTVQQSIRIQNQIRFQEQTWLKLKLNGSRSGNAPSRPRNFWSNDSMLAPVSGLEGVFQDAEMRRSTAAWCDSLSFSAAVCPKHCEPGSQDPWESEVCQRLLLIDQSLI